MAVELQDRRRLRKRRRRVRRIQAVLILACLLAVTFVTVSMINAAHNKNRINDVQAALEQQSWVDTDLLPVNAYSRPGTPIKEINAIVIHYVGNPGTTAAQNRSYYARLAESAETSASSNFVIGLDGEILECVPVNEVAYCSNWRNDDTISIECCHPDETGKFSDDTYQSLVKLTAWLCLNLGLTSSEVIRHYDVSQKECPKYYVDHEDAWTAFRSDVQAVLDAD